MTQRTTHTSVLTRMEEELSKDEAKKWKKEMEESGKFAVTAAQTAQIKMALKKIEKQ